MDAGASPGTLRCVPDEMIDASPQGDSASNSRVARSLLPASLSVAGFCITQLILTGLIRVVVGIPYYATGEPAWLGVVGLVLGLVTFWPSFLAARWLYRFAKAGFQSQPPV